MKQPRCFARLCAFLAAIALGSHVQAMIISAGPGLGDAIDWGGVGKLGNASLLSGTGTLISPRHVLTAAHMVDGLGQTAARFEVGGVLYNSASIAIHPGYNGTDRWDLAVVTLAADIPNATWYRFNDGSINELTAGVATIVGYGVGGAGATGEDAATYPYGTLRQGQNAIDMITSAAFNLTDGRGNIYMMMPGLMLYDFDNHLTATNGPLGVAALGSNEGDATTGDSGGPVFQYVNGEYVVTGITVSGTDALVRFGDVGVNVQVGQHAAWIAQQIPEPGIGLFIIGFAGLLMARGRSTKPSAR